MDKILIIKACGVEGEDTECVVIEQQATLYGCKTFSIAPNDEDELRIGLKRNAPYDLIYVSSHGNDVGLCNASSTLDLDWDEFGSILCDTACMNQDCILMLSCCRGGLNQVAYTMMYCCRKVSYIVGPRQSLSAEDMLMGYSVFLYNLRRGIDPVVACNKIEAGTDMRFKCFDRLEIEGEASYMMFCNELDKKWTTGTTELLAS